MHSPVSSKLCPVDSDYEPTSFMRQESDKMAVASLSSPLKWSSKISTVTTEADLLHHSIRLNAKYRRWRQKDIFFHLF